MPTSPTVLETSAAARLARFEAIFRLAPLGIGITDLEGRAVLSNDALGRMLGYSREEFSELPWEAFTHPDDVQANRDLIEDTLAGRREQFEMVKRFFHKDGSIVWGRLTASTLRSEDGPTLHIGILEDITERQVLEEQLRDAEATYRLLVEEAPAVVYVAGLARYSPFTYVSPQIRTMLGYTPEEWLADPTLWSSLLEPEDLEATLKAGREARDSRTTDALVTHYRMRRRDGSQIWVRDAFRIVPTDIGEPTIRGVLVDVTREKELEARLERQASHDPLTQLPNRELFTDRVAHRLARMSRSRDVHDAVVFIDLDDFKTVNDSLGHAVGDELIRSVADRIAGCLRPGDSAGRLGGDEFALLIEGIERASDALAIAERVQEAVQRPHQLTGQTVVTEASLGLAYLRDARSADMALRNADLAMYRAKELGKGRIAAYDPAMHSAAVRRLDIRTSLQEALERNEFTLHLQPIVDLTTLAPISAEALLRWSHPKFGPIAPAEFIPIAEETGTIGPIGGWVLHRAGEWLATQHRAGADHLSVSVNVSPVQLDGHGLLEDVTEVLAANGLPPRSLVLEITERALVSEPNWQELRAIQELGVRVAIDDFGTGYASLEYLSKLSVDMLKIDRLFVGQLGTDERSLAVPRAITQLATSLGMEVVAEGIETAEQRRLLRSFGCAAGQGHLFAPPRSVAELLIGAWQEDGLQVHSA